MSNFEANKVFAAVLCAGITIWSGGILAGKIIAPKVLEKDAVSIEGEADGGHGGGEAATAGVEPILALLATADVEKGAKISKACAACHSFEKGGAIKQGPNLWGIIGHNKAAFAGFDYSAGLKAKGGAWNYAELNEFLWKPKKFVADTKMNFIGLKKPEDRAAMIAWLRQQSDTPAALPSEAEIAAEAAANAAPAPEEGHAAAAPSEDGGEAAAPVEGTPEEGAAPAAVDETTAHEAEPAEHKH